MTAELYLGLISGTSADGIDAALVRFDESSSLQTTLIAARTFAYAPDLRARAELPSIAIVASAISRPALARWA